MSSGAPVKPTKGVRKSDARKRGEADSYYNDDSVPTHPSTGTTGASSIPSYMSNIGKPYVAPPVATQGFGTYSPSPPVNSSLPVAYNPHSVPVPTYAEQGDLNPNYHSNSPTTTAPVYGNDNVGYSHPQLTLNHQDSPPQELYSLPGEHHIYNENPEYHSHQAVTHTYDENTLVQKLNIPLRESVKNLCKAYKKAERDQIAHFEQYSIASGLCKKCFPKGSDPKYAPRPHNYRPPRRKIYYVGKYRKVRFLALRRKRSGGLHFHWWDDTSESSVSSTDSSLTDSGSGSERTRQWRRQDIHEQRVLAKEKKHIARDNRRQMKYLQREQQSRQNGIFGATGAAATTMWKKARESWVHSGYSSDDGLAFGDPNARKDHNGKTTASASGMFVGHAESSKTAQPGSSSAREIYYDPGYNKAGFNPHYYKPAGSSSGNNVMFAASREPEDLHRITKKRSHRKKLSDASSTSGDSALAYGYGISPVSSPDIREVKPKSGGFWPFGGRKKVKKRRSASGAYSSSSVDENLAFGGYPSTSASPASALRQMREKNKSQQTWDTVSLNSMRSAMSIANSISSSIKNTRKSVEGVFGYGPVPIGSGRVRERRSGSGFAAGSPEKRPTSWFLRRRESRESNKSESEHGSSLYGGVRLGTPAGSRRRTGDSHRHIRPPSVHSTASNTSGLRYGTGSLRSQGSRRSSITARTHSSDGSSRVKSKGGFWGMFGSSGDKKKKKKNKKGSVSSNSRSFKGKAPATERGDWEDFSGDEEYETYMTPSGEMIRQYRNGREVRIPKQKPESPALSRVFPKASSDPTNFDVEYAGSPVSSQTNPAHRRRSRNPQPQRQESYGNGVVPSQITSLPPPSVAVGAPTPSPVYPSSTVPPSLASVIGGEYTPGSYTARSVPPLPPAPQSVSGSVVAPSSTYHGSMRSDAFSSPGSTITNATIYTNMTPQQGRPALYNDLSAGSGFRHNFEQLQKRQEQSQSMPRSEPTGINTPVLNAGGNFNHLFQVPTVDTLQSGGVFNSKLTQKGVDARQVNQEQMGQTRARELVQRKAEEDRVRKSKEEEEARARANFAAEEAIAQRMEAEYEARVAVEQASLRRKDQVDADVRRRKWEEEQTSKQQQEARQMEIRRMDELRRAEETRRIEMAQAKALHAQMEADAARRAEELRLAEARRLEQEFAAEQLRIAERERKAAREAEAKRAAEEAAKQAEWERLERIEKEKIQREKEEAARLAAERERLERMEREKIQRDKEIERLKIQKEREEAARLAAERERLERIERERVQRAQEEAARLAPEREQERLAQEEAARVRAAAAAAEAERSRLEKEKKEYEERIQRERIERERMAREKREHEEKLRLERVERERIENEQRLERERILGA